MVIYFHYPFRFLKIFSINKNIDKNNSKTVQFLNMSHKWMLSLVMIPLKDTTLKYLIKITSFILLVSAIQFTIIITKNKKCSIVWKKAESDLSQSAAIKNTLRLHKWALCLMYTFMNILH